jgi:hypothetical protein
MTSFQSQSSAPVKQASSMKSDQPEKSHLFMHIFCHRIEKYPMTDVGYVIYPSTSAQREAGIFYSFGRSKVTLKHFGILGVEVSSHALETFFTMLRE